MVVVPYVQLVFDLLASLHGLDLALEDLPIVVDEQFTVLQVQLALVDSLAQGVDTLNRDFLVDLFGELEQLLSGFPLASFKHLRF